MKKLKVLIIIGFLFFTLSPIPSPLSPIPCPLTPAAHAYWLSPTAGSTAAAFLKVDVGARPAAMGGAFCAVASDVSAIHYNPAGLVNVEGRQFYFMHNEWLQEIRHDFMAYAQTWEQDLPIAINVGDLSIGFTGEKAFGFAIKSMYAYGMERRANENLNDLTDPQNFFDALDIAAIFSYSQRLAKNVSWGVNMKIIQQRIDADCAYGLAFDIGGLHRLGNNLDLGWAVQNLGAPVQFLSTAFPMPLNFKVGAAYEVQKWATLFVFDINQPVDNYLALSAGAEHRYKMLALRGGYEYKLGGNDLGPLSGLSMGFGLEVYNMEIDYAFIPYTELESYSHRFSLLVKF